MLCRDASGKRAGQIGEKARQVHDNHEAAVREMFIRNLWRGEASVFDEKGLLDSATTTSGLVGRRAEMARLVDYLSDVEKGYLPPLIQVYGPPGTGKTTVVRSVAAEAARPGSQDVGKRSSHFVTSLSIKSICLIISGHEEP